MVRATGLSLKGRALRYLAQREHSRLELERKLARFAVDAPPASATDQIRCALDELAARGLLSDQRAAAAMVSAKARRFGNLKLRHTLRSRGLAPEHVAAALAPIQDNELERAREVWRRRFGSVATDPAERARQARFLAGRGFSGETIFQVVKGLDEDS